MPHVKSNRPSVPKQRADDCGYEVGRAQGHEKAAEHISKVIKNKNNFKWH